jgi:methyltransferase (TIGR00027 family)
MSETQHKDVADNASQLIGNTAAWIAAFRAAETRRPDRLFEDPHAHLFVPLNHPALELDDFGAGLVVARTVAFDEFVLRTIAEDGVDLVLNLAAGYDTRAYRLPLPPTLRWVEVDLEPDQARKQPILAGVAPRCDRRPVARDRAREAEPDALLDAVGREATRATVVTEGFLQYLEEEQVAGLARALSRQASFRFWATGIMSPGTRNGMNRNARQQLAAAGTSNRFAPARGAAWFEDYGWELAEGRLAVDEMVRLGRGPSEQVLRDISAQRAAEDGGRKRGFDGTILLRRRSVASETG